MKSRLYKILIIGLVLSFCTTTTKEQNDYLVYAVDEPSGQRHLIFYDPFANSNIPIPANWSIDSFSISQRNQLAFSSSHEGVSDIFVLDYPFWNHTPTNITGSKNTENHIFSWSIDGHYLAYEAVGMNGKTLSIWDGKRISQIHHYQNKISELTWSEDDQLAFTEFYTFSPKAGEDSSEIFIWDGGITKSISQNPSGEDRFPAWNSAGKLAFLSNRNGKYDIFVWDGKSNVDGMTYTNSFTNVAPELTQYYSMPVWTNSDLLTFIATSPTDGHAQIYEWNGQAATNISHNPTLHNGGQSWRSDGYWSFGTFFSPAQLVYVRDKANKTIFTTEGELGAAWSKSGLLLFCFRKNSEWTLSLWDGNEVVRIANGNQIEAYWQNGKGVFCTSG